MIELALLLLLGVSLLVAFVVAATVLKVLLWVVLLPIRLVFWTIGALFVLPLLILKALLGGALVVIALPILAIAALAGVAAVVLALLLPLVPFVLLGALAWYLLRPENHALVRS